MPDIVLQIGETGLDAGFKAIPAAITAGMLMLFLSIGYVFRVADTDGLWVAGRSIGNIENGMAIGANWMSAASYLGVAGLVGLAGYYGLAYLVGWTAGFFILLIFMAAQFRRFGKYTAPDFIGDRFYSDGARAIAAFTTILIGFVYAVGQGRGMGLMSIYLFGTDYTTGVVLLMGITIVYVALSGMLGATKNMAVQYVILIAAFLVGLYAVGWSQGYSTVLPYIEFGNEATYVAQQLSAEFSAPFANASYFVWVATAFTLIVGTCGLPHVLVRFYTVENERTARWSCVWGLFFICLLYWGTAAYAAFGGILAQESGVSPDGALFTGTQSDVLVVLTAQLAELPQWLVGLVAAGAVAAALATTAGLFIAASSAAAHDIYTNIINEDATQRQQLLVGRATIVTLGVLVTVVALNPPALIGELVSMAFAIAGSVLFPVFFLGLWWENTNRKGAIAGMLTGLGFSLLGIVNEVLPGYVGFIDGEVLSQTLANVIPATSSALVAVPVVFAVIVGVSWATEEPPEDIKKLVRQCHSPEPMQRMESAEQVVSDGANTPADD
ncbi:VC_2705 family sodium/solute symporter [Haloarchaeobius sp. HME9146]|uniref:VC_2705 family sodium/solute symporter n=1 Tax=Haloarchaeobius sp. HME9146 TaxID=2978732 RepID=UPI0021C0945E|nr:VC_2705 family sodium/solute symporter [Haloarchaeobius sp. HME9146]MCT9098297.1 VC_2705 family sodium/solute symporter [Haloarchaeobius sp. HME9146]